MQQQHGDDRRVSTKELMDEIHSLQQKVDTQHMDIQNLKGKLDDQHRDNVRQQNEAAAQLLKATTTLDRILKAFPEEDPEGHCRYHQEVIDEVKERKKLWIEIRAHILKGSAWALLVGLVWGLWNLLKFNVTR